MARAADPVRADASASWSRANAASHASPICSAAIGGPREGVGVAALESGDHRLSEGEVGRRGRAAGAGIGASHLDPVAEIEEDGVDVDRLQPGELVQGSFDGADGETGGVARHQSLSGVRLGAQRTRRRCRRPGPIASRPGARRCALHR